MMCKQRKRRCAICVQTATLNRDSIPDIIEKEKSEILSWIEWVLGDLSPAFLSTLHTRSCVTGTYWPCAWMQASVWFSRLWLPRKSSPWNMGGLQCDTDSSWHRFFMTSCCAWIKEARRVVHLKRLEKSYTKPVRKMPYPVFEVDPCTARGGGANHVERCSIKCLPGFKSFYFTKLEINISFSPDFKSQTTCIFTMLL